MVAKTANVLIGEIVEKGEFCVVNMIVLLRALRRLPAIATQKEKGVTGPLTPEDIREAHKALQEISIKTGGTGVRLTVNGKKKPLFGGK